MPLAAQQPCRAQAPQAPLGAHNGGLLGARPTGSHTRVSSLWKCRCPGEEERGSLGCVQVRMWWEKWQPARCKQVQQHKGMWVCGQWCLTTGGPKKPLKGSKKMDNVWFDSPQLCRMPEPGQRENAKALRWRKMREGSACPWLWHLSMSGHRYLWEVQDFIYPSFQMLVQMFSWQNQSCDPQGRAVQITAQKIKNKSMFCLLKMKTFPFSHQTSTHLKFCFGLTQLSVSLLFLLNKIFCHPWCKNLKMKTHLFHFSESRKRCFITSESFTHLFFWTDLFDKYSSSWQMFSVSYRLFSSANKFIMWANLPSLFGNPDLPVASALTVNSSHVKVPWLSVKS